MDCSFRLAEESSEKYSQEHSKNVILYDYFKSELFTFLVPMWFKHNYVIAITGLHERGTLPISWMDFMGVKPGTHTEVHVSLEYRKRLQPPHGNCVDYDSKVKQVFNY